MGRRGAEGDGDLSGAHGDDGPAVAGEQPEELARERVGDGQPAGVVFGGEGQAGGAQGVFVEAPALAVSCEGISRRAEAGGAQQPGRRPGDEVGAGRGEGARRRPGGRGRRRGRGPLRRCASRRAGLPGGRCAAAWRRPRAGAAGRTRRSLRSRARGRVPPRRVRPVRVRGRGSGPRGRRGRRPSRGCPRPRPRRRGAGRGGRGRRRRAARAGARCGRRRCRGRCAGARSEALRSRECLLGSGQGEGAPPAGPAGRAGAADARLRRCGAGRRGARRGCGRCRGRAASAMRRGRRPRARFPGVLPLRLPFRDLGAGGSPAVRGRDLRDGFGCRLLRNGPGHGRHGIGRLRPSGVERAEPGRNPGERGASAGGAGACRDRVPGRERRLHRLGERGLALGAVRRRPRLAQGLAGDGRQPVLAQPPEEERGVRAGALMRGSGPAAFARLPSPEGPPASPAPFTGAAVWAGTSSGRTSPRTTAIVPSSPRVTMHPAMARSSGEYSARASTAASMASMRPPSRRSSIDSSAP